MKRIALISALLFAVAPFASANAQNAASVVTRATSDATARAVSEATSGATQDALKPNYKPYVAQKAKARPAENKGNDASKKRAR